MNNFKLKSRLELFEEDLNIQAKKSLKEIGTFIKREAVSRVPVDTGALQESIDYQILRKKNEVEIGTDSPYAVAVEMGTSKMKAQPYLEPSGAPYKRRIFKIAEKHISKAGQ